MPLDTEDRGRTIAVLDSGVDSTLPGLTGRVSRFARFDPSGLLLTDELAHAADAGCHGSKVCGLLANGAPDANLIVARVLEGPAQKEAATLFRWLKGSNGSWIVMMSFSTPIRLLPG